MSYELHKAQLAIYTSTSNVDNRILKYYSEEDKRTQAARAWAEYTILSAWWDKQGYNKTAYDLWCSTVKPRGFLIGGSFHTSQDEQRLIAMIDDYKETFLPDYDNDNVWWGEGEEPLEGYALEYVWVKHNVYKTVSDSGMTRLGAHRRYLDLRIEADVSSDFYLTEGLPF